jgi:predicted kinase
METNHRTVIITRGIPGSGKSTYAKLKVAEGWNRVNKDDIRTMINGYKLSNADEDIVHNIQTETIKAFMAGGRNFIVDNTHAKEKYVDELVWLIEEFGSKLGFEYEIIIKVFDTPLEECLRRNALRETPIMEEVIRKMHKQLFK